jgi:hypothetical protein
MPGPNIHHPEFRHALSWLPLFGLPGLTFASILTLVVVPVLYVILFRVREGMDGTGAMDEMGRLKGSVASAAKGRP